MSRLFGTQLLSRSVSFGLRLDAAMALGMKVLRTARQAFDPQGLMNPGKLISDT